MFHILVRGPTIFKNSGSGSSGKIQTFTVKKMGFTSLEQEEHVVETILITMATAQGRTMVGEVRQLKEDSVCHRVQPSTLSLVRKEGIP